MRLLGAKAFIKDQDLSQEDFQLLVKRRAIVSKNRYKETLNKMGIMPDSNNEEKTGQKKLQSGLETLKFSKIAKVDTDDKARKEVENEILQLEKIHKTNNLLPVSFLYNGSDRAKALCRISTPTSYGTGFLIAPGILMTNNHVLTTEQEAAGSIAEFFYEENRDTVNVQIKPQQLFITNPDLDFTIVGCDTTGIEHVEYIPLLRNPSTVTRYEQVNIVQHPRGRRKEIAIHENQVKRVQQKTVRYITDTEPGSSGSAVFNNQWELVALHHAGVYIKENNKVVGAENEGIRISAIVDHLVALNYNNESTRNAAAEVLNYVNDSSPFLGFFDVAGLVAESYNKSGGLEVEIPTFTADRKFADIGFWNIEHLNNGVSDKRIKDVADVVKLMSMDVLGLVEVQNGALDRLVDQLALKGVNLAYEYYNAHGTQDLAVLYDKETSTVEMLSQLYVDYKDLLDSRIQSGQKAFAGGRLPLFAKCTVLDKDRSKQVDLIMIVVHLKAMGDSISKARRKASAQILYTIISDLKRRPEFKDLPIVLGGDFNDVVDSYTLASITNATDLFTLTTDDHNNDAMTYVGGGFTNVIDHIVVSTDAKLGTIADDDAAIIRLDRSIRDFADHVSDHVPVITRLLFQTDHQDAVHSKPVTPLTNCCTPQLEDPDTLAQNGLFSARHNVSTYSDAQTNSSADVAESYYNQAKDKKDIKTYYESVSSKVDGKALFWTLNELISQTHTRRLSYSEARYNHLYARVDLRPGGQLNSVYSDKLVDPETMIKEDLRVDNMIRENIQRLQRYENTISEEAIRMAVEEMENSNKYNCEHVVPQSWFGKKEPMKSDLHHLFTCLPVCNSSRSNYPYYDFPDYDPEGMDDLEAIRADCGKYESSLFEPENHKGVVARATLYFLLRYPNAISKYNKQGIDKLLEWHKEFPHTENYFERHRNQCIFEVQGNRNPLIDFPEWADKIDFMESL